MDRIIVRMIFLWTAERALPRPMRAGKFCNTLFARGWCRDKFHSIAALLPPVSIQ